MLAAEAQSRDHGAPPTTSGPSVPDTRSYAGDVAANTRANTDAGQAADASKKPEIRHERDPRRRVGRAELTTDLLAAHFETAGNHAERRPKSKTVRGTSGGGSLAPMQLSCARSAWDHPAMPSTVRELFAAYGLEPAGCVPWGQPLREPETGVYVVALTADADNVAAAHQDCPLDQAAFDDLVRVCPRLLLDGEPTTAVAVSQRIASFWIADEVALYIGRAGQPVGKRVGQYYRTPIGAAKPHKGGWWIKTLAVLPELYVHWARTPQDVAAEDTLLDHFAHHLSNASRATLPAGPVMPFANLMDAADRRKVHGIRNATTGDTARRSSSARGRETSARLSAQAVKRGTAPDKRTPIAPLAL